MPTVRDRILVVEPDLSKSELIGRQALQPAGYDVLSVFDAAAAMAQAARFEPDVILVDLALQGLSGKDLLVAFRAQGFTAPVIVIAQKGMEADAVQAIRLGAVDALLWPVRETEVINTVENVLKQIHERRDRETETRALQQANQELQQRVRELTNTLAAGKAILPHASPRTMVERIVEGAVRIAQADVGYLLGREDAAPGWVLAGERGLPRTARQESAPWNDGISGLTALSGGSVALHGDALQRFPASAFGRAALITPLKAQRQVIGLLVVLRKEERAFSRPDQRLLEAYAELAAIAYANVQAVQALEQHSQPGASTTGAEAHAESLELLSSLALELRLPLEKARQSLFQAAETARARQANDLLPPMANTAEHLQHLAKTGELMTALTHQLSNGNAAARKRTFNLNDTVRQVLPRFQRLAQQANLDLVAELGSEPIYVPGEAVQLQMVVDGLLANAVKYSPPGAQVLLRVDRTGDGLAHLMVRDFGLGFDPRDLPRVFDRSYRKEDTQVRRPASGGISLALMKAILAANRGNIWLESKPGQGSAFHVTLPPP